MLLRALGAFLVLAGTAAACYGLAIRFTPGHTSAIAFGSGFLASAIGFGLCVANRGESSRACVGFIAHVGSLLVSASCLFAWKTPSLAAVVAVQLVVGVILIPCVLEARRRVGKLFLASLAGFVLMLALSIVIVVQAY